MSNQGSRITLIYDGETFRVSEGRTVLVALEEAGLSFIRGVGCRGGVCGACGILYRLRGEPELHSALMCQEMVKDGMEIMPLPYFPQKKMGHEVVPGENESPAYLVVNLYPEVNHCIMCGECTRLCPMGIDVMGYVGMIKRGDLHGAGRESFVCVQCQVCALRCPSRISQPNVALAARRLHGRWEVPRADHLSRAIERLERPELNRVFRRLQHMDPADLQMLYQRREREPDDAPPGTWLPEDRSLLI
ncbi:MAG: 2Fe-2S iron-sulfur cluster binding domain-containing protein [Magnetococcales bacterium]|nr:2Fe-2S iron-sulfur cluster binding domain-containing protein [Magnetococcales bacterium]